MFSLAQWPETSCTPDQGPSFIIIFAFETDFHFPTSSESEARESHWEGMKSYEII